MDGPLHTPEALRCTSHQRFRNLLKCSIRQCAYLFACREEVQSIKKQNNDASGDPPPLFLLHYLYLFFYWLYLSMRLLCLASSYSWLSSPFDLAPCHSFPWNPEAADCMPQGVSFQHLPLALPWATFENSAHRVGCYLLLWEAFFFPQLLHLTPLSAPLYVPCHVLCLWVFSPLRWICSRLIPLLCT